MKWFENLSWPQAAVAIVAALAVAAICITGWFTQCGGAGC